MMDGVMCIPSYDRIELSRDRCRPTRACDPVCPHLQPLATLIVSAMLINHNTVFFSHNKTTSAGLSAAETINRTGCWFVRCNLFGAGGHGVIDLQLKKRELRTPSRYGIYVYTAYVCVCVCLFCACVCGDARLLVLILTSPSNNS